MDGGTVTGIASLFVAGVAAFSSYASQRAASKASMQNTDSSNRTEMEKDAYARARSFDTETIRRQDEEIDELRKAEEASALKIRNIKTESDEKIDTLTRESNRKIATLTNENQELRRQVRELVLRITRLERTDIDDHRKDSNDERSS